MREYAIEELMRPNIRSLVPYSSARSEFTGDARVFLDANENWRDFVGNRGRNRYPDPLQKALKKKLAHVLGLPPDRLAVGNGSDETIDLLFRIFCVPGKDNVLMMDPTYGAYRVFADINDVFVSTFPLKDDFTLDMNRLETVCRMTGNETPDAGMHKLLFLCSPNNPSGNSIPLKQIGMIANWFRGITVVDEAYYEFSGRQSAVTLMEQCPRLVVLRTLSKCWALADARIGMAVAPPPVVLAMNKVKYPYNMSGVAQELAIEALDHAEEVRSTVEEIKREREALASKLAKLSLVRKVFPSDANFLLVRVGDPDALCAALRDRGIIIRNRSAARGCDGCVRITIGSKTENETLLSVLGELEEIG